MNVCSCTLGAPGKIGSNRAVQISRLAEEIALMCHNMSKYLPYTSGLYRICAGSVALKFLRAQQLEI